MPLRRKLWTVIVSATESDSFAGYNHSNFLAVPALVRTLLSTSHCHRLFPFLRIVIVVDPIDLSFLKKYGMQYEIWRHGKALERKFMVF
jgi:hypothetical protein